MLETSYNEGKIKGKIEDLLMLLEQKLGPIPPEIEKAIKATDNLDQINAILSNVFKINNWETLKKSLL